MVLEKQNAKLIIWRNPSTLLYSGLNSSSTNHLSFLDVSGALACITALSS
jgi:hypothetical protein